MVLKSIKLNNRHIDYTLKINKKSKSIRLSIHRGGRVVLSCPKFVPQFLINRFLISKSIWILEKIDNSLGLKNNKSKNEQREEYLKYKDNAYFFAKDKLDYFNKFYNLKYNNITIRNQKTRWGSCSKKGNLNFNYKIVLIPIKLAEYIIVHELCHLKEFNHGKNFWEQVAISIPDYKEIRNSLKQNELKLD